MAFSTTPSLQNSVTAATGPFWRLRSINVAKCESGIVCSWRIAMTTFCALRLLRKSVSRIVIRAARRLAAP
jgi:hypothetical protein